MLNLPAPFINLLDPFKPVFDARTWNKVIILVIGAILTPGKRTVTAALRVMGLGHGQQFSKYHQVLNRNVWSSLKCSQIMLRLLLSYLDQGSEPLVFGIDETIERRTGAKIKARGIYRDPVRSSGSHFVKASGLRWMSVMWLAKIPWAERIWALPFLTALCPSQRYYEHAPRQHKKLTDWARQLIFQLRRWLPHRDLVIVADNSYSALDLLHACQSLSNPVSMITRLRLDAALYEPAPPYAGIGRPRKKGKRLPTPQHHLQASDTQWHTLDIRWYDGQTRSMEIASQTAVWFHYGKPAVPIRWVLVRDPQGKYETLCLLCTNDDVLPQQIVEWFVLRWQLEVTFEESRRHLGLETQRQWSDLAIARTTPCLLALFSWITLVAHLFHQSDHPITPYRTAWYTKPLPTFSDALALLRFHLWLSLPTFQTSPIYADVIKVPRPLLDRLLEALCYAA